MQGLVNPNIVAIDLGAESCRVSLLQWKDGAADIQLIHRFSNAPIERGGELHWDLDSILGEVENGLRMCAQKTGAHIASIGVDGWGVDYVRIDEDGLPIGQPFCYRDVRTEATEALLKERCSVEELYLKSGVQPMRINTIYQLMADQAAGVPAKTRWVSLPEYLLARLGGRIVGEYTHATHTGLVDAATKNWNKEIFELAGLSLEAAPELVSTGSDVGEARSSLAGWEAFRGTRLIAPACHDTASAVAGIPIDGDDWAYISSGTWSLVGALIDQPVKSAEACAAGFTNLGAAGGRICFHKIVNGMWLLKQTLTHLCGDTNRWPMAELVAAAEKIEPSEYVLDVGDPKLMMHGAMATRINAQLEDRGLVKLKEDCAAMPQFASLIFHSLATCYAEKLANVEKLTGKKLKRLAIVGGGSLNQFLNRLTAEATGLELCCGAAESSTVGNFAIQLATLEGERDSRSRIAHWAQVLTSSRLIAS